MKSITLYQPKKLVFGEDAFQNFIEDISSSSYQRVWILSVSALQEKLQAVVRALADKNRIIAHEVYKSGEPNTEHYNYYLEKVREFNPDLIVGIGGGSVLDLAKILAAMKSNTQTLEEVIGRDLLQERNTALICLPTTSGTGSEVSPNSILLDENTLEKKGIISPFLMPDASYIDPILTLSLPRNLTAETSIDALSHCMEAFTNKHSHPMIDSFALKGIALISKNVLKTLEDPNNVSARSAVALGSMYGGMCLGPVNTAAVHALSYPLGGKFHVPHGLANAILLPEVLAFNLEADIPKHAEMALALGVKPGTPAYQAAQLGVEKVKDLVKACGINQRLQDLGVKEEDINMLATLGMKVKRLLDNNPREMTHSDAEEIYKKLL
ncbi:iron-containing alcohol dehydrogenase [Belliella sp. DSM 111904]|uniref:Iron-containing alcohol dehydrogenase n=1 Tax=Belliella filtrata TaxID=2923435 RepID=A0ABS9UVT9_9BACT|nr:iron-containing alcohol dehydrogenase [Belliella filtrata]MCH7408075.1 iron-containing alcohol dehydrogenase [Belliella filtrata]